MIRFFIKKIFKNYKILLFVLLFYLLFMFMVTFGPLKVFNLVSRNVNSSLIYLILCFMVLFIYFLVEVLSFVKYNKTYRKKYDYLRELPVNYSPSMVSYLMDLKLEIKKDMLADLIYLEEKGIIKIDYYEIITIINKDYKFLDYEKHLKYLCTKIDGKRVKEVLYDKEMYMEYENLIINSLYERELIKPYESKGKGIVVLIIILMLAFSLLFNFVSFNLTNRNNDFDSSLNIHKFFSLYIMLFIVIWFFSVIMIVIKNLNKSENVSISKIMNKVKLILGISNMNYARTRNGKRDVSLLISYYKFIKEFSIMEKREFKEKNLWGYYFAYGLALGINKNVIKKFNLEYNRYFID